MIAIPRIVKNEPIQNIGNTISAGIMRYRAHAVGKNISFLAVSVLMLFLKRNKINRLNGTPNKLGYVRKIRPKRYKSA